MAFLRSECAVFQYVMSLFQLLKRLEPQLIMSGHWHRVRNMTIINMKHYFLNCPNYLIARAQFLEKSEYLGGGGGFK